MALLVEIVTAFTFFRGIWDIFPVVIQTLLFFVFYVFLFLGILRMSH